MRNSGKLLIAAMLLAGLAAAGASWWFRYAATHQAAQFWGPEAVQLIRDAPHVELLSLQQGIKSESVRSSTNLFSASEITIGHNPSKITAKHDISAAPGLTHLRNALLEDRSFNWGAMESTGSEEWTTALTFRNPEAAESLVILFVDDFERALKVGPGRGMPRMISTQPIAAGLAETITEWSHDAAAP
jgi:hypothetical protein